MRNKILFSMIVVLAVVVSACGSAAPTAMSATDTPQPVIPATGATNTAMPMSTPSMAEVMVGQDAMYGSILMDSQGRTLYLYTSDSGGMSTCTGGCATNWPPLLTTGAPQGGSGANAAMLGTTSRSDGTTQVTYNGWPLYYYIGDTAPGQATGEGKGGVWFVVTADGVKK